MSEEINQQNPIEDAKNILSQIEKAKAENQAMLERMEQLKAEQMLSGKSIAGIAPQVEKSKEELIKERVNKLLSPTGMKI